MKTGVSIRIITAKLLSRKKITKSTQSIETVEREITSTEPLNIIVNDSDTRSRKSNQHYTGDKSSNLNDIITSQNKGDTNRKKIFIRNEKTNVFVSGIAFRNDRLNDKGKSVNSLLKGRCDKEKICFVDNTNINVGMLNNSGLNLNKRGNTRL